MKAIRKKSLRGSLRHYANPALMDQEQGAWQTSAGEKENTSTKAMQLMQNKGSS